MVLANEKSLNIGKKLMKMDYGLSGYAWAFEININNNNLTKCLGFIPWC